jgi:hypothetical protein
VVRFRRGRFLILSFIVTGATPALFVTRIGAWCEQRDAIVNRKTSGTSMANDEIKRKVEMPAAFRTNQKIS